MPLSPSISAADGRSLDHADIRLGVDAAGADAAHVKRQPDHAMGVAAAQIGLDHKSGERFRILRRQAGRDEGAGDEGGNLRGRNAAVVILDMMVMLSGGRRGLV